MGSQVETKCIGAKELSWMTRSNVDKHNWSFQNSLPNSIPDVSVEDIGKWVQLMRECKEAPQRSLHTRRFRVGC